MEYIDLKAELSLTCHRNKEDRRDHGRDRTAHRADTGAPYENVSRFLESCGYRVSTEQEGKDWLTLRATKAEVPVIR